ncbi:hypothetical protein K0I65_000983 [Enterococcus faecalis]|nr:hypothetical protein [Enterococcus faecalis]
MSELRHQEIIDRVHHMYLQTDGIIEFPNSFEGDLLKIAYGTAVQSIKQSQLNESQQIVLDWLECYTEREAVTPIDTVARFWRERNELGQPSSWQLNGEQQAQVLQAFSRWAIEQEEG